MANLKDSLGQTSDFLLNDLLELLLPSKKHKKHHCCDPCNHKKKHHCCDPCNHKKKHHSWDSDHGKILDIEQPSTCESCSTAPIVSPPNLVPPVDSLREALLGHLADQNVITVSVSSESLQPPVTGALIAVQADYIVMVVNNRLYFVRISEIQWVRDAG